MKSYFFGLALVLLIQNTFTLITSTKHFNLTTDENALLAFKIAITSDPSGVSSNNWSTNTPICSWTGVSCSSKHRRVTAVNVSGLGLLGTIPPHLGNLTFLQSLDISSNNFTGSVPSELSNLRRLKVLNLGFNKLAGEMPAWIGNFSYLEMLSLASNYFRGSIPNGVFNTSSLRVIDMRFNMLSSKLPDDMCDNARPKLKKIILPGNQLYGEIPANIYRCRELEQVVLLRNHFSGNIPSEIGRLSKLRILAIWSNGFSGSIPEEIGYMPSLEYLDLSTNNLEGNIPSSIFDNSSLIQVDLSNNSLTGSIPTLNHLPKLEELYLLRNKLTGSIPAHFGNVTSLRQLSFYKNNLEGELPQELANLINLEYFSVEDNSLSGSIPPEIFNISSLNSIRLSTNALSGNLPRFSLLINLEKLSVEVNNLDGPIPSSINNASKLTHLSLSKNSFSGSIPDFGNLRLLFRLGLWGNNLIGAESPTQELRFLSSLANCQNLERLELSLNPLNGILPTSIGNLSSSLAYFSAFQCNIGGVIPSEIGNLSSLLYIHLQENRITGFIPTSFGKLAKLQKLYLRSNQLQGFIPRELCQMSNLGELDLSGNMITHGIPECLGELTSLSMINFGSNKLNSTLFSSFWNLINLVSLNLSSNYLRGEISSEIGNFKTIITIDLSSNQFSCDITSLIDGCQSLEVLNLSNNRFGGSIPQSLKNIRGLRVLNISNNNLSGLIPKSLADLSLQYLNLSHNKLEGEIPNDGCFVNFTAQSFVYNSALCGATRFQVPPCLEDHEGLRSKSVIRLMKFIFPALVSTIIVVIIILLVIRRRNHKSIPMLDDTVVSAEWKRISYIELERGTTSFSETNLLGRGSVGSVFKGTLFDGLNVAVKVFNLQLEGTVKSFGTESKILSTIRHRNLVRVIGCCSNTEFKALILSYMPNGSLDKWLHSDSYCLDLVQRLNIAIDVALALEYLHHGHTFPIVHCDIKPSNVLLDEDMTAHVGDFGISKLFDNGVATIQTKTLATIGYAAPEYGTEGKVSTNGDVYSYGILLLEMLTEKRPTDDMFGAEISLREWVSNATQKNAGIEISAFDLVSTEDEHFSAKQQCVLSMFELAMKCLVISPKERINMIEVGTVLHKIKVRVVTDTMGNNVN